MLPMRRSVSIPFRTLFHFSLRAALPLAALVVASCTPQRDPGVIVLASGADLESANPLVTTHPLSRQIQRYALFVTLLRYDSTLTPQPYFARSWNWTDAGRTLTLSLAHDLRWHDGVPTTSRDAAFTFLAARDPATGFPRAAELATLDTAIAVDDTTLLLRFSRAPARLPALLAELPIVPAHLLMKVPRSAMRGAAFEAAPVGNGPFRFAGRQRGARWSFVRNDSFPASLGGPPKLRGLVIAVVDEATTKFAGLASGELDMAGIAPTMAALAKRDATLRVLTYPIPFGVGLFSTPRARLSTTRACDSRLLDQSIELGSLRSLSPDSALPHRRQFHPKARSHGARRRRRATLCAPIRCSTLQAGGAAPMECACATGGA